MIRTDVVIIGAGISGLAAALAASSLGCSVTVVSAGTGNFISTSGYIEILGYCGPDDREPVTSPAESLGRLIGQNPFHPYALLGREKMERALNAVIPALGKICEPFKGSIEKNLMMPTALGALNPAAFVPGSAFKDICGDRKLKVAGIRELMDFYPGMVSRNLSRLLNRPVEHFWISLGLDLKRSLNSLDVAILLEKEVTRERLLKELQTGEVQDGILMVPAVLGLLGHTAVMEEAERLLGCPVLEIPTIPPSVAGYRLGESLRRHLARSDVEFIEGVTARGADISGGKAGAVILTSQGGSRRRLEASAFILATGGIIGGGLEAHPHRITETVWDLPVAFDTSATDKEFFSNGANPYSVAGVTVNSRLQPMKDGDILYENLFVAGSTLYGYDGCLEKSGTGVSIITGFNAGLYACGE